MLSVFDTHGFNGIHYSLVQLDNYTFYKYYSHLYKYLQPQSDTVFLTDKVWLKIPWDELSGGWKRISRYIENPSKSFNKYWLPDGSLYR